MKNLSIFEPQIEKHYAYKKKHVYEHRSLDQSMELVHLTNAYLNDQVAQIRIHCNDLPVTLNELKRSTFNTIFVSLHLVEWGLRQLKSTLDLCQYEGLKLLPTRP